MDDINSHIIIYEGIVESVEDDSLNDGFGIKVRTSFDHHLSVDQLPVCYPLLPALINVRPKVGEMVYVFFKRQSKGNEDRQYIGPVISQPQFFNDCQGGFAKPASATKRGRSYHTDIREGISKFKQYTDGAFPDRDRVALIGRKSDDLSVGDGLVILRSGVRKNISDVDINLNGDVGFNNENPSFFMLRHKNGLLASNSSCGSADSVALVAADKFAFVSRKQQDAMFENYNGSKMIKDEDFESILKQLHKVPYGDLLVKALEDLRKAVENHTHPWANMPPIQDDLMIRLQSTDYDNILSNNTMIS